VVTDDVRRAFDVPVRLLPATDDPVATRIHTADGRDLHFQEYWVRERAEPVVDRVELGGAASARPAPGVVEALLDADVVLVAPSNPVVSIDRRQANGYAEVVIEDDNPEIGDGDRRVLTGNVETTALDHGSGVGLWLVRWFVERSYGRIEYESPGEKGNRIRVKLPKTTADDSPKVS
jgi:signal transduction histidine kinase